MIQLGSFEVSFMSYDPQVLDNNNALEVTRLHTFFRCRSACAISKKAKGTTISSTRCVPTGFRFRSGKIFTDSVTWVDHLAALIAGLRCCCTCIRFQLFAWHQGLSLSRPTEWKAKSCKDYISMCLHSPSAAGSARLYPSSAFNNQIKMNKVDENTTCNLYNL